MPPAIGDSIICSEPYKDIISRKCTGRMKRAIKTVCGFGLMTGSFGGSFYLF